VHLRVSVGNALIVGGMLSWYLKRKDQYSVCVIYDTLKKYPEVKIWYKFSSQHRFQATVKKLFDVLGIPRDSIPLALTALERHSQNDILYDPLKAKSITKKELRDGDNVFKWLGLPFDTRVTMEEFTNIMKAD